MSLAELKKLIGNKKLILGTERTLKLLKKADAKEVFLSSNCNKETEADVVSAAKKFGIKVSKLDITNEEMGVIVKKPFAVSIVSLQK